jgi:hypothetical protein
LSRQGNARVISGRLDLSNALPDAVARPSECRSDGQGQLADVVAGDVAAEIE